MSQFLRAYRADDQPETGPIRFVASTEGVKRDGLEIIIEAWELDNYRKNPVFLWAHDYMGEHPPIGRAEVATEKKNLVADVTFDSDDPFAAGIERKYRKGFLNAVSVGWDTLAYQPDPNGGRGKVLKADLLDISAVPVPGDPDALMERQKRALSDLGATLNKLLEPQSEPDTVGLTEAEAAALMLRVFDPASRMTEAERKAAYNRAEKFYRQLSRQAPEFLPLEQLRALGAVEIGGLFLHNELESFPGLFTEARAGAVLNTRNRERLAQIRQLAQEVLDSAEKEKEKTEDEGRKTEDDQAAETARAIREALEQGFARLPAIQ